MSNKLYEMKYCDCAKLLDEHFLLTDNQPAFPSKFVIMFHGLLKIISEHLIKQLYTIICILYKMYDYVCDIFRFFVF